MKLMRVILITFILTIHHWRYIGGNKLSISPYSAHMPYSRITKEMHLMCISLGSEDLSTIFIQAQQLQRLVIDFCKVIIEKDIKTDNKCIRDLSFQECCGDEINISEISIENLVNSICASEMKDSLKLFNIYECAIEKEKVKEMFSKSGVDSVDIVCELWEAIIQIE